METISGSSYFLSTIADITLDVRDLCIQFLPLIVVLVFAYGFIMFLFGMGEDHKLDLKKYLFIPIFYTFLIAGYPTFVDVTGKIMGVVINTIDSDTDVVKLAKITRIKEDLQKLDARIDIQKTLQEKAANDQSYQKDSIGLVAYSMESIAIFIKETTATILRSMSSFWDFFEIQSIRIIRTCINYVRDVFLSFMIIVGSFVILLSIIPMFKGMFQKWFKLYIAITLWALTISILDKVVIGFAENGLYTLEQLEKNATVLGEIETETSLHDLGFDLSSPLLVGDLDFIGRSTYISSGTVKVTDFPQKYEALGGSKGIDIALNVILVICYCLVPYLTSLYAGGEASGMFMSKVVGMASMATRNLTNKAKILKTPIAAAKKLGR
ncbi:MAG: hypothetical protein LBG17_00125 [Bacteroidales bacterium]|jgi:hypothetical protein|nr:hypothetical protein [Bacteroidales bacterium]